MIQSSFVTKTTSMRSKASFPFPFAILSLFFKSVILWCVIKYCHQAKSCKTHFKQGGKKKPNSVSYQSLGTVQCYQYRRIYGWVSQRHQLSVQWSEVDQSCPTLCDPMGCSLTDSSVHGIFQATVLEWIAISFSRGSSQPRDRTWVSHIVGRCFTIWATREALWET